MRRWPERVCQGEGLPWVLLKTMEKGLQATKHVTRDFDDLVSSDTFLHYATLMQRQCSRTPGSAEL